MKRKFFLSLLAIGFTALSASAAPDPERLVLTVGNVEHLSIEDNIDVILIQGAPDNYSIMMDQKTSDKLNLRLSNNKLAVSLRNSVSKKEKFTVYIYVNNLRTVTLDGESVLKTFGSLNSPKIELFIGGDAKAHLRSNGKIKAYSLGNAEIDVTYVSPRSAGKKGF